MSSNKFLRFFESQVSLIKDGQTMHTCGNANWSYIMDKMTSRKNCEHYVEKFVTNYSLLEALISDRINICSDNVR